MAEEIEEPTEEPKIEMQWGQTPFTSMSRQELERAAQMLYSALSSAHSVLNVHHEGNKQMARIGQDNPYWSDAQGSGGRAFHKADYAMKAIKENIDSETIYRSFFRYADDLLFPGLDLKEWRWRVCPNCGNMLSSNADQDTWGKVCGTLLPHARKDEPQCGGIMRPLNWNDLKTEEQKSKDQARKEKAKLRKPMERRCDREIAENGVEVFHSCSIPSKQFDKWVKQVAELSKQPLDWCWQGGYAVVLTTGNVGEVYKAVKRLLPEHDLLQKQAVVNLTNEKSLKSYLGPKRRLVYDDYQPE